MRNLKTKPDNYDDEPQAPNAVYSLDEASTSRYTPSDWSTLPPEIRMTAERIWRDRTLNVELLEHELTHYWDKDHVCQMARHGIRVGDMDTPIAPFAVRNSQECASNPRFNNFLATSLQTEIDLLRTIPRPESCAPSRTVHSIFVKDESNAHEEKFRDIHNLSAPRGISINDTIKYAAYVWVRAEDIARRVTPTTCFAKIDLRRYYRTFLIDPADWHLLAFKLFGKEFWDTAMEWGLRNAVEIAHRFTTALIYIFNRHSVEDAFGVLDDFLFLAEEALLHEQARRGEPSGYARACARVDAILGPDSRNTKAGKSSDFSAYLVYCGNEWSRTGVRMAPEFKAKLQQQLANVHARKKERADKLDTLLGRIVYAGITQWGIRTVMTPLLELQQQIRYYPKHYTVKIEPRERRDALYKCIEILDRIDGMALTLGDDTPSCFVETDAAAYAASVNRPAAIGIYFPNDKFCIHKNAYELRALFDDAPDAADDIAIFEAYAPLAALRLAPDRFRNRLVGVQVDNPAASAMLHRLRGPSKKGPLKQKLQTIAEAIFWELTYLHARFSRITLVRGEDNAHADAVSRADWPRFLNLIE
jgi:hypothetical protein